MTWPFTLHETLLGLGVFLVSLVVSFAVVVGMLVGIAPDYFVRTDERTHGARGGAAPILRMVGKNLLGLLLIALGLALSVPGVPGQGLLTVLVGVMLLDIPRKRRLERRIVSRPALRRRIDQLRARFGRPPLVLEPPRAAAPSLDRER